MENAIQIYIQDSIKLKYLYMGLGFTEHALNIL
jgi:hypothetical protein